MISMRLLLYPHITQYTPNISPINPQYSPDITQCNPNIYSMVHPGGIYLWGLASQPHPINTTGFPIFYTEMCSMELLVGFRFQQKMSYSLLYVNETSAGKMSLEIWEKLGKL